MPRFFIFTLPKKIRQPILLSWLISLSLALLSATVYLSLQPVIPIFYSSPNYASYLATKEWIFLFPILSGIINLLHLLLTKMFASRLEITLMSFFCWATVVIQILLALSLMRILLLVT